MNNPSFDNEIGNRPRDMNEFIGQKKLKENLSVFINAAKIRGQSLDHTLFYGPPGLGKTTLANIIAKNMGVNIHILSGPSISKVGDLAAILTNLKPGDVLFIDEIHRLSIAIEESLYPAMEDFRIDILIGEGPTARTINMNLSRFTLVGATTRMGLLSAPMRTRFGISLALEFYERGEIAQIAKKVLSTQNISIENDGALSIAQRSRGTPRIAIHLCKRIADFSTLAGKSHISISDVESSTSQLGIDEYGLDSNDIKYLRFIAEHHMGGPVGINTISAGISDDIGSIETIIEPFLLQEGFISRTHRGRTITQKAIDHLNNKDINFSPD